MALLLPGHSRWWTATNITVEAGCSPHMHSLWGGAIVQSRWHGGSPRGWASSGLRWSWAAGWPTEYVLTRYNMQVETPQAGFCIHIAAVVIGKAIRGTREAGFFFTAVTAATDWLPIPDVTVRTLLWALEAFTGGCSLRYSWATTGEAGGHAALQPTHIGAALLGCRTVLRDRDSLVEP